MITLDEFIEELKHTDNLVEVLQDEDTVGTAGLVWRDQLHIEDTQSWPDAAPGKGRGRWYLMLGNSEYQSDDLRTIAQLLYDWADEEGYLDA